MLTEGEAPQQEHCKWFDTTGVHGKVFTVNKTGLMDSISVERVGYGAEGN